MRRGTSGRAAFCWSHMCSGRHRARAEAAHHEDRTGREGVHIERDKNQDGGHVRVGRCGGFERGPHIPQVPRRPAIS